MLEKTRVERILDPKKNPRYLGSFEGAECAFSEGLGMFGEKEGHFNSIP